MGVEGLEPLSFINVNIFSPLDESHMKVGVRALARLHALSYAYFKRCVPHSEILNIKLHFEQQLRQRQ